MHNYALQKQDPSTNQTSVNIEKQCCKKYVNQQWQKGSSHAITLLSLEVPRYVYIPSIKRLLKDTILKKEHSYHFMKNCCKIRLCIVRAMKLFFPNFMLCTVS